MPIRSPMNEQTPKTFCSIKSFLFFMIQIYTLENLNCKFNIDNSLFNIHSCQTEHVEADYSKFTVVMLSLSKNTIRNSDMSC